MVVPCVYCWTHLSFFFLFLEFSFSLFPRPELQSFQEENLVITLAITLVHASPNHPGLNLGLFISRIGVKCKYGTDLSGIEISKTIGIMIISKKCQFLVNISMLKCLSLYNFKPFCKNCLYKSQQSSEFVKFSF